MEKDEYSRREREKSGRKWKVQKVLTLFVKRYQNLKPLSLLLGFSLNQKGKDKIGFRLDSRLFVII
ncbi:MAG: hypothetical protein K2H85_04120 [Allobaculum sp.]|nr:hypothetical protein [Allobaculum sp.]